MAMIKSELSGEPMPVHGGDNNSYGCKGKPNDINQGDNVTLIQKGKRGNSKTYLLRRLAKESKAGSQIAEMYRARYICRVLKLRSEIRAGE